MTNNDEIKPIEEIPSQAPPQAEPPKQSESPVSGEIPVPTPPQPSTQPAPQPTSQPLEAPLPPSAQPTPASAPPTPVQTSPDPGKRAVIRRTGGEGGWIKYALGALVLLIIGAGAFYFFFYRVTFEINPSPAPDKILLDNNEIKPGTYRVKPGVHTLFIQKKGFVSYISSKKYSIGEKASINFKFVAEKAPTLSAEKGRFPIFSSDKKYLFFLDKNSAIAVMDLSNKASKPSPLTETTYPTTKILKISKDKKFAALLDDEAIKIINFTKTDLLTQSETKLPPLASAIHSFTWNSNESKFFPKANSEIIYDMQTTSGWNVFFSDLSHSQANIILSLDNSLFSNLQMDWGESPNKALIVGGEIGILDITKRKYDKIPSDKSFVWGKWGPGGERAVAIDSEGGAWLYKDSKLEKLPFLSKAEHIDFVDNDNLAAVSEGRPVKYNISLNSLESFAEVKDLASSFSFISREDIFYFETTKGIFSGHFEKPKY